MDMVSHKKLSWCVFWHGIWLIFLIGFDLGGGGAMWN